jgi:hypothetical protein
MGTNYYWIKEDTTCPHCGRRDPDECGSYRQVELRMVFQPSRRSVDWDRSLDDWIERFDTGFIEDEYGDRLSVGEMMERHRRPLQ